MTLNDARDQAKCNALLLIDAHGATELPRANKHALAQQLLAAIAQRLPDNLPAVRQSQPRVLEVNGLYRHGFMISPTMHDITLQVLADGTSPLAAQMQVPVLQG